MVESIPRGEVSPDACPIRVMSFNVRGSFRDMRKKDAWRKRAALNVATMERYTPDLIGLQEAQRGNLKVYRKRMPRYSIIRGPRYGNVVPYDFNAILFDPARLELLDSGGFWLSETPERHSRSWQTRIARSATWALFHVLKSDLPVLHLNTHLDHVSARARREGSELIVRKASELSAAHPGQEPPLILTGDFNSRPGNSTYGTFMEAGYVDTYLAAGGEDGEDANTFHAFRGTRYREAHPGRGPRRIDWILLKDTLGRLRVKSHGIIRDERSGRYPSDHYPILAEFVPDEGGSE